jgi:nicotinamidase-related amidase
MIPPRGKIPLLLREESLLVIIDMQERLVPAMCQAEEIVANTKRLLALAGTVGLPVVVTEQQKLGPTLPELSGNIAAFDPVPKLTFNCFSTEAFAERVRTSGRNTLIIAGIEAHICVTQTALWAPAGYQISVVADAVSSRSPHNAVLAMERIRAAGMTVTSTEMVIYEMLQQGGTDEFRAMLPFVK